MRQKRQNLRWDRITFFLILPSMIISTGVLHALQPSSHVEYEMKDVIVNKGDTLWSIAGDHMEEGGDIRRKIYEIEKENGLHGNYMIKPGDTLKVKVMKGGE